MVSPRMRTRPRPNRAGVIPLVPTMQPKKVRQITAQHDTMTMETVRTLSVESRLARFIISHRDPSGKSTPLIGMSKAQLTPSQVRGQHYLTMKKEKGIKKRKINVANSIMRGTQIINDALLIQGALSQAGKKRVPTVYEVAALGMLKYHGITPEFIRYLNRMHSVYVEHRSKNWWSGSPQPLQEALRIRLPGKNDSFAEAVETILKKNPEKAFTTTELAEELGLPLTQLNQTRLAVMLNFLLAAHVVKNQPNVTIKSKTSTTPRVFGTWSHAGNKNPPIEKNNSTLALLAKIRDKERLQGINYETLELLLEKNVIMRSTRTLSNGNRVPYYALTPQTEKELEHYEKTGEISERMRRVIVLRSKKMQKMKIAK